MGSQAERCMNDSTFTEQLRRDRQRRQDAGLILHIHQGWSTAMDYPARSTSRRSCERSHQDLLVGGTLWGKQLLLHPPIWQRIHHEMDAAQCKSPFDLSLLLDNAQVLYTLCA